jgi:hypothetical protein
MMLFLLGGFALQYYVKLCFIILLLCAEYYTTISSDKCLFHNVFILHWASVIYVAVFI